jgi:mono/diheme cytochrome c family protein
MTTMDFPTRVSKVVQASLLTAVIGAFAACSSGAVGGSAPAPSPPAGAATSGALGATATPAAMASPAAPAATSTTATKPAPAGTPAGAGTTLCRTTPEDLSTGVAPRAFINSCSGCHGVTGMGQTYSPNSAYGQIGYPNLRANYPFELVQQMVRGGKVSATTMKTPSGQTIPLQMPAFTPQRLSDADLMTIYTYISSTPNPNAPPFQYCLPTPEATWTTQQIQDAYTQGLTAWRTAGAVDQHACAHCHGPDGIDLAMLGFPDSQIYRRAFFHVDQPTADAIVDMVHAIRAKYNIADPPNPLDFRPFQPGGAVLPGASSAERDQAFGQQMKDEGMTLMGPPINSVALAKQAWSELAAVDLRTEHIGIPLNRWAEDIFDNAGQDPPCPDLGECPDHGTMADWLPDAAQISDAQAQVLYPLEDAYLANPTLDTFKTYLEAIPTRDDFYWINTKYLAVQIGTHFLRMQAQGQTLDQQPAIPLPVENGDLLNSPWMVGANARDFAHNDNPGPMPVGGGHYAVPPETIPGLTRNNAPEQLARMEAPWFWMGWQLDPSTLNARDDYVAEASEYFTQQVFLDNGSYPIHGAFIVSKRTVSIMAYGTNPLPRSPHVFPFYHPDLGNFPVTPLVMRAGYFPELVNFSEEKNFNTISNYQLMYMPTDNPTHTALYETYTANMYRMFMWELLDELQATPQIWNPSILLGKVQKAEIFLTLPDVAAINGPQDTALLSQIKSLIGSAQVMN